MVDDVEACLSWAHTGHAEAVPVGELLTVVIILLFADAQGCVGDIDISGLVNVQVALSNDHYGCFMHVPLWVGYLCKVLWMVIAPFRFAEACVGSQDDSVSDGMDKGVLGCVLCKLGHEVEHAVRDHFLAFWYIFVFFNCVSHYFNVIYVS